MRIRTQFIITVLLLGIVLVVIAASAIITNRQVEKARRQENIADEIVREASALGYLCNDYLIYHESQQLKRWQSMFASFSAHVADLRVESPEGQALVRNIQANQSRIKEVFDGITSVVESLPGNKTSAPGPVSLQVSWSRMAVQNQELVSDASRLSHVVHDQMDRLLETRTTLIYVMVALVGALFLSGYTLAYRRILNSIAALRAGAGVIGSGDLDFVIEEKKDDEIGELSHAFNRMVTDLKTVTASKSDMEREILERTRAEIALKKSEERWATTVASIGDAVIATDVQGQVTFINAVAEELTGWTFRDALAMQVTEVFNIINEHTRSQIGSPVAKVLREGMVIGLANHTILVKKDGTEVPIDDSGAPIRDKDGNTTGVVLVFRDITERKKAEEALRENERQMAMAQEALQKAHDELELRVEERTEELRKAYESLREETSQREQAEKQFRQAQKMEALGTLTGGIAHDFNNMLAAIIGFTELVADHAAKGSRDERHLKRIMESSLRGRDLVRQMLIYSRNSEQEKKPLSLGSIVKEAVRLIRATTPTTISIRANALGEPGLILADPTQIQQVVMNLCTNAAHAMQEKGGTLDIEVKNDTVSPSNGNPHDVKPGRYARLTVRDTGVGIPPDIIDKVFDPFFTTKKLGEGTGLGLSVVHGIVTQSNGHITVESKPGKGTTFTLYFPQITGQQEADAIVGDDEIPTGSERILFVDDEEALVEMGEDILAELGYDVTSRMSSTEALALLKENPSKFDLVITDQTMPEMTGVDLAKKILAIRPDMPIIMCTGFSHVVNEEKAKAAGISAFAMKPLTKREIAKTIRKVLDE